MSKSKGPIDSIDLLGDNQAEVLRAIAETAEAGGFESLLDFNDAYGDIDRYARGYLSERTRAALDAMELYRLWDIPEFVHDIRRMARRDFNLPRRIYVQKGLVQLKVEKEETTQDKPADWNRRMSRAKARSLQR